MRRRARRNHTPASREVALAAVKVIGDSISDARVSISRYLDFSITDGVRIRDLTA